jgi:hypothetical protein
MPTLLEILDLNNIVLVDSSIRNVPNTDFSWDIYDTRSFSALDKHPLIEELISSQVFVDILAHPNSRTIPSVTQETKEYLEIVTQKLKCFLGYKLSHSLYGTKRKSAFKRYEKLEDGASKKSLFEELHKSSFKAYQLSKSKELKFNSSSYDSLLEIIKLLSRELNLKFDTSLFHFKPPKDPYERDTDEKMISALYWMSMHLDKSVASVSNDRDFNKLLACFRVLGAREFSPYNDLFVESIRKNPPKLYLREPLQYRSNIDTYFHEVLLDLESVNGTNGKVPIKRDLQKRIHSLWKDFSKN